VGSDGNVVMPRYLKRDIRDKVNGEQRLYVSEGRQS